MYNDQMILALRVFLFSSVNWSGVSMQMSSHRVVVFPLSLPEGKLLVHSSCTTTVVGCRATQQPIKYLKYSNFSLISIVILHPSLEQDLSLKIEERDQTIWICMLELQLFHSSQMKSKLAGLFFQKSTRWRWAQSKMHRIKKPKALLL